MNYAAEKRTSQDQISLLCFSHSLQISEDRQIQFTEWTATEKSGVICPDGESILEYLIDAVYDTVTNNAG